MQTIVSVPHFFSKNHEKHSNNSYIGVCNKRHDSAHAKESGVYCYRKLDKRQEYLRRQSAHRYLYVTNKAISQGFGN